MVFFVSEIGVNWDGDFTIVKRMIEKSKECGCDAVKFQSFNQDLIKSHPEKKRLMKTTINEENIEKINRIANEVDIEWFSTPMYPEAVKILDPYVNRFKVREFDGREIINDENNELIQNLIKTKKEVIVSSEKSPKNCNYYKNSNFKWLYCVPKYPCSLNELNFSKLNNFNGYSNHVRKIIAPLTAVILGAEIIEVHITDNNLIDYVDNNVSLDYNELKKLIEFSHQFESIKK
jgi:N,N'-diacetyllegionaminate synthase